MPVTHIDRPGYGEHQLDLDSPPVVAAGSTITDRARLDIASSVLRRYAIAAGPASGAEAGAVRDRWQQRLRLRWPDGDGACAFWLRPDAARCFDADGALIRPLPVHLGGTGTADAVTVAARRAGLDVQPTDDPDTLLIVGAGAAT